MSISKQWFRLGLFLLLTSTLPSLVMATIPGQLPFLIGQNSHDAPLKEWYWWAGFGGKDYDYGISDELHYHGNKCIYIRSLPADPPPFSSFPYPPSPFPVMATLSQRFKADKYHGKRMKFSAFIKSEAPEGSAALALTIDGGCQGLLEYDYMQGRNITGITDWMKAETVLDVPLDGDHITIGITMAGKGQIWVGGLKFEETTDVSTGKKMYQYYPRNLDFSE